MTNKIEKQEVKLAFGASTMFQKTSGKVMAVTNKKQYNYMFKGVKPNFDTEKIKVVV